MVGSIFTDKEAEAQEKLNNLDKIEQLESGGARQNLLFSLCTL